MNADLFLSLSIPPSRRRTGPDKLARRRARCGETAECMTEPFEQDFGLPPSVGPRRLGLTATVPGGHSVAVLCRLPQQGHGDHSRSRGRPS